MHRICLKYDCLVQDKATSYERLVLAVISAWVQGRIGEVVDLHFQVCSFMKLSCAFQIHVNHLVHDVGNYSYQDHCSDRYV